MFSRRRLNVTGRDYKELKVVKCFECDTDLKTLWKQHRQFLKTCHYIECAVFLCPACWDTHHLAHDLAGDLSWEDIKIN